MNACTTPAWATWGLFVLQVAFCITFICAGIYMSLAGRRQLRVFRKLEAAHEEAHAAFMASARTQGDA